MNLESKNTHSDSFDWTQIPIGRSSRMREDPIKVEADEPTEDSGELMVLPYRDSLLSLFCPLVGGLIFALFSLHIATNGIVCVVRRSRIPPDLWYGVFILCAGGSLGAAFSIVYRILNPGTCLKVHHNRITFTDEFGYHCMRFAEIEQISFPIQGMRDQKIYLYSKNEQKCVKICPEKMSYAHFQLISIVLRAKLANRFANRC